MKRSVSFFLTLRICWAPKKPTRNRCPWSHEPRFPIRSLRPAHPAASFRSESPSSRSRCVALNCVASRIHRFIFVSNFALKFWTEEEREEEFYVFLKAKINDHWIHRTRREKILFPPHWWFTTATAAQYDCSLEEVSSAQLNNELFANRGEDLLGFSHLFSSARRLFLLPSNQTLSFRCGT